MKRYHITVGAKTTVGGTVVSGWHRGSILGQNLAREGDQVKCPECDSTGTIICVGPRLSEEWEGRKPALDGDLCKCKCDPSPKLIANQTIRCQTIESSGIASPARAAAQPAKPVEARQPTAEPSPSSIRPATSYGEQTGQVCQNLWRSYQQRAEAIVAPGGILIADPKARNRAINAAYARLWLEDQRFQWAGLAAFASKQVGCGLLHAAQSVERIQNQYEAGKRMVGSAQRRWKIFGIELFGKTDKQLQRDYELSRSNNPIPSVDWRTDRESLSLVQGQLEYVHDMLALGNTTLFLDVYPLHVFYRERGLEAMKDCLGSRSNIYGHGQHPVLWPVGQKTLEFGIDHEEILLAFEAIEAGNIAESVEHLAKHEQVNILQPAMYSDWRFNSLLYSNHLSYLVGFPSGAAEAIELTLASQCRRIDDGRTIGFSNTPFANLADINQRMAFVLRAAKQFDDLLHSDQSEQIERSIRDIALGGGVR
ncbi:PAAR domain-containing protein [Pseudomonas umsongensis]|uniref:PAAR domain-containing protein n=1 Tax=Pseudomonas umsongensis TaxID=198618 RepID=UPI00200AC9F2|nr:PAAR domain-containing protein [Pseudomonas umsongensis]MCK8687965.1 PAAR domain-containing protein [Pseudomonas umsongensis]